MLHEVAKALRLDMTGFGLRGGILLAIATLLAGVMLITVNWQAHRRAALMGCLQRFAEDLGQVLGLCPYEVPERQRPDRRWRGNRRCQGRGSGDRII